MTWPYNVHCPDCKRLIKVGAVCAHPTERRLIHLDEVCELLGWGEPIDDIARRLGVQVASIERVVLRRGTEQERAVIRRALESHGRHRSEGRAA